MGKLRAITGRELIKLLKREGWTEIRNSRHGIWLRRDAEGETRFTTVKDTGEQIPQGTLSDILGPKQTGLGKAGLERLLRPSKVRHRQRHKSSSKRR